MTGKTPTTLSQSELTVISPVLAQCAVSPTVWPSIVVPRQRVFSKYADGERPLIDRATFTHLCISGNTYQGVKIELYQCLQLPEGAL